MRDSRLLFVGGVALAIGFLVARWSAGQSAGQRVTKEPQEYDFGALNQLQSFVTYLHDTKQEAILQRFNDFESASTALQQYSDMGFTLAILQRLRNGQTNSVLELLEGKLSGDITGFVVSYREIPVSVREQTSLKTLMNTRDYRTKYPFKHRNNELDAGVAEAFKILDEKTK